MGLNAKLRSLWFFAALLSVVIHIAIEEIVSSFCGLVADEGVISYL